MSTRKRPSLKDIVRAITPPVLWSAAAFVRRAFGVRKLPSFHGVRPLILPESGPAVFEYYAGRPNTPVFFVPAQKLRYPGGMAFSYQQHHFMRYYADGRSTLEHYYRNHQPKNIFEQHFLTAPAYGVVDGSPWLVADDGGAKVFSATGKNEQDPKHGRQQYGPMSDEGVTFEAERLSVSARSIEAEGYDPAKGGYPLGYILLDTNGEWVFYVATGRHRAAALVHLGHKEIPVSFVPYYPRFIRKSDSANWPMVQFGALLEDEALRIFAAYFRKPDEELPVWSKK